MDGLKTTVTLTILLVLTPAAATIAQQPEHGTDATASAANSESGELFIEVIRDRYPDGNPKIQREVARTTDHSYVNHGEYKMWDEDQTFLAGGRFELGRRVGTWKRIYKEHESPLFAQPRFQGRFGPFTSTVDFQQGRLHGTWTMTGADGSVMFTIPFVDGQRHGKATFYHDNGKVAQETNFSHGQLDGWDRAYDDRGNLTSEAQFIDGQKYTVETKVHTGTQTIIREANVVYPAHRMVSADDWWNARLAVHEPKAGDPINHGPFTAWHVTGQIRVQGTYHMGQPVGEFTWHHADGEVAISGQFVGGAEDGMWHWWHPNGMKATEGRYAKGERVGQWIIWNDDGSVASLKSYTASEQIASDAGDEPAPADSEQSVQLLRRTQNRTDAAQR